MENISKAWTSIMVSTRQVFFKSKICEPILIGYFHKGNKQKDKHTNMTHLETYYWRAHPHWATVIGYNWFFAVLAFFHHKWLLYSWNYMDITIAIFGRAMSFRFKCLFEEAENKLLGSKELQLSNLGQVVCNGMFSIWHILNNCHIF